MKWDEILEITPSPDDHKNWYRTRIDFIRRRLDLSDTPECYRRVRDYCHDEIALVKLEIAHKEKWAEVFHESWLVPTLEIELATLETVRDRLSARLAESAP